MMPLLLLLQVAGPVLPAPRVPAAATACPADGEADEVVVCGRRDDERFRLRPLPPPPGRTGLPMAETTLPGGAKAAVQTEQANVGGAPSNRVMVRLSWPF